MSERFNPASVAAEQERRRRLVELLGTDPNAATRAAQDTQAASLKSAPLPGNNRKKKGSHLT